MVIQQSTDGCVTFSNASQSKFEHYYSCAHSNIHNPDSARNGLKILKSALALPFAVILQSNIAFAYTEPVSQS